MNNKKMIKRLKDNEWLAFGGFSTEERTFLAEVEVTEFEWKDSAGGWRNEHGMGFSNHRIYRLKESFTPVYEGLFIPEVDLTNSELCQPVGREGCAISNQLIEFCTTRGCSNCICGTENRKQLIKLIKARGGQPVKARYAEYKVYYDDEDDEVYYINLTNDKVVPLAELPNHKGFGGAVFRLENGKETAWSNALTYAVGPDTPPLPPFKVRIWEDDVCTRGG